MSKKTMRFCSFFLTVVLIFNLLPLNVLAEEFQESVQNAATNEEITTEVKEIYVLGEDIDKRTEFSKEFRLSDGTFMMMVYPDAVHYEEQGQWEEIDNTLTLTAAGTYTTTAGSWNVSFPQQLTSSNKISITQDGYTLSMGMAGQLRTGSAASSGEVMSISEETLGSAGAFSVSEAQSAQAQVQEFDYSEMKAAAEFEEAVADKLYSGIQYTNVYANTNVKYDVFPNQVKESIVIGAYDSRVRGYQYELNMGNMIPVLAEDGHIDLYDEYGENIVMVMPAPYLVDSAGEYNDDIELTLTRNGTAWMLTYLVPQEWLAAEEREWPVILDPVVEPVSTSSNIHDRTVAEEKTLSADWGMNACGYRDGWGVHHFYLKFLNLPELKSSDYIISAVVELYDPYNHTTVSTVEVHKVLETWTESGISWDDAPDFDTVAEDFARVSAKTYYYWDITSIARGWYQGENTGMMFKMPDEIESTQTSSWKQFYSTEFGNIKPTITLIYRNSNGIESYWDYTSSSAGRAGTGYVNSNTGNLVWVRSDIGFGGNLMPVSISHIYNANDADCDDFGLGYGWRTNFNQLVYQWTENTKYYIWEDSDGTDHYFLYDSDETAYLDEDGLDLKLTKTGSGNETYCIEDEYGNKSYFDSNGRLTQQVNNQKRIQQHNHYIPVNKQ